MESNIEHEMEPTIQGLGFWVKAIMEDRTDKQTGNEMDAEDMSVLHRGTYQQIMVLYSLRTRTIQELR